MGWFKREIRGPGDLKGLKFRTSGLAVDMFTALGMSAVQMAPADIVRRWTGASSTAPSSRARPTIA
jgi:TRAP-type mannitol/chloroaromatic compound transport system substrate-binding protein